MGTKIRVGMGKGGLAQEQWRSLSDLVGVEAIEVDTLGLEGTTDHSEVLIDRLLRGDPDAVVIPTPYVPNPTPEGVVIAAVAPRLTPLSAFLAYDGIILDEFESGAVIGAETPIVAAQLRHYRPELTFAIVDGAIRERLRRLEDEEIDALVVPAAFVEWLGLQERASEIFSEEVVVPEAGQGSLSLLGRAGDERLGHLAEKLNDRMARREVEIEREVVRRIRDGGPALAGALARQQGERLELTAVTIDAGGRHRFAHTREGDRREAEAMAREVAEAVLGLRAETEV